MAPIVGPPRSIFPNVRARAAKDDEKLLELRSRKVRPSRRAPLGETVPVKDFEGASTSVPAGRGHGERGGSAPPWADQADGAAGPRTGRLPGRSCNCGSARPGALQPRRLQTKLNPRQQRIFRDPGLENSVRALRVLRNTYIHAGARIFFRMRRQPRLFFAGQITKSRATSSAATGFSGARRSRRSWTAGSDPDSYTTAIGSLARHCSERPPAEVQRWCDLRLIEDTSHSPVRDKQLRRRR
jgi:hypothetical protein